MDNGIFENVAEGFNLPLFQSINKETKKKIVIMIEKG